MLTSQDLSILYRRLINRIMKKLDFLFPQLKKALFGYFVISCVSFHNLVAYCRRFDHDEIYDDIIDNI